RIRPEHVVELLDNAASDARRDARDLATMLSRFAWRISSGSASAQGSSNRIVSNVREITVSVAGRNFQLHCTETPSLKLERITACPHGRDPRRLPVDRRARGVQGVLPWTHSPQS